LLQLRAKRASGRALLDFAASLVERAKAVDAVMLVNDRADIARIAGASGVHVGQDDLPPVLVRRLVGRDAIIGLSTHTDLQMARAMDEPVDYLAIGPVFGTSTKETGYEPVGLARVRQAAALASSRGRPLVAIGGITLDTAPHVIEAGAASVAVISDLFTGGNPARRVRDYLARLGH
jgi:thiamine-phosphate pyrophosphorylase